MEEALNLYIYEPADSKDLVPLPDESIVKAKNIVEVAVNPEIAFSFMVRYHRLKNNLSQMQAAKKWALKTFTATRDWRSDVMQLLK